MHSMNPKAIEARARRAAMRVGLIACKSRSRVGSLDNFGEFMLVDARLSCVVQGSRFELTAQAVLDFCTQ